MRAIVLALGVSVVLACAAHDPPPGEERIGPEPPLQIGLLYWAQPRYLLDMGDPLVLGVEVMHLQSRPAEHPELRGPTIVEATLRVERVFHQTELLPSAPEPPRRVEPGDRVLTDGGDGLAVGDRVLMFVSDYDGGYGVVPARETRTPIGIVVHDWSDPIVAAVERSLRGEPWSDADEEAWRPYGEAALECRRHGTPLSHCSGE